MKTYNTLFKGKEHFADFVKKNGIEDGEKTLIQVFCGIPKKKYIKSLIKDISDILPKSKLIGTTTAHEIFEEKVLRNSCIISISVFEDTIIKTLLLKGGDDLALGKSIAKSTICKKTKALIVFSDGLISDGEKIIKGIESVSKNINIAGGRAGDNGSLIETFVFDKNEIVNYGVVAASLNSDTLKAVTRYSLDWQPVGKEMKITKAEGNRVYEIDGKSVKDIYRKYLGDEIAQELPYSASEFPFIKKSADGTYIARAAIKVFDDGSLSFIGHLKKGDIVRFGFGNADMIITSSLENTKYISNTKPESIFIYSCAARLNLLQEDAAKEIAPFSNTAKTCGFFTYGEYYSSKDKNELLNMTMTILALSENSVNSYFYDKSSNKKNERNNLFQSKHFKLLKALTNLSNSVAKDLKEEQEKLEKLLKETQSLANKDYLTGLYNRHFFYQNAKRVLEKAKRNGKPLTVATIDIDKFKEINDTFGHKVGDRVLKETAKVLKKSLRSSDLYARFGGEEFCVLLEDLSYEDAVAVFEKMRKNFENNVITVNKKPFNCTISIGVFYGLCNDIDHMIAESDILLYKAKRRGRNRVVAQKADLFT
ncbi:diguanylate cyclase [Nitrosophilus alvini]|uniref:sensor domain-containing diguanylate cyclase n=1 Tax=Nitrosophilus alvini TaxID=2714855 RepID=UPI001909F669|nr:diguanylate cyclase [Nitrosophilus alvini]